jgi:hypothetical protein
MVPQLKNPNLSRLPKETATWPPSVCPATGGFFKKALGKFSSYYFFFFFFFFRFLDYLERKGRSFYNKIVVLSVTTPLTTFPLGPPEMEADETAPFLDAEEEGVAAAAEPPSPKKMKKYSSSSNGEKEKSSKKKSYRELSNYL